MNCDHCGATNSNYASFCQSCGNKLNPTIAPPPSVGSSAGSISSPVGIDLSDPAGRTQYPSGPPNGTYHAETSQNGQPPFLGNRNRYEAVVPLLQTFRFIHEPIGTTNTTRFIGRQNEMESLAERILFSEGGSFLVTGYRGVGKTSFINQVVRRLEESLPWAERLLGETRIVDIYLNVARPVQPSEIMHHIIRRMHDRLIETGIFHLLGGDLRDALRLSYLRTSLNMARKLAETSERSFGFNEASIGGEWMKAALKMSWSSKRSRTQNIETSFLGYDDKSAEHDIISISRRLADGYLKPLTRFERLKLLFGGVEQKRVRIKVVFVFDELDKLEEFTPQGDGDQRPIIDQILGGLKNLFTTSGVTFVFVAGKDLQERWLEDVGKGDSVYESVFSYDKYLPCLWTDVDSICDGIVDSSHILAPYDSQVFEEFKKYLAYKGRGIPRRIIRTFNEYVEWSGNQLALAFTRKNIRFIRFFAGLQDILVANESRLADHSHEEALGTQSDKRRLGIYYLIDWILRQGTGEFTLNSVLNASKRLSAKIALAEEIAPQVTEKILDVLMTADYIQEVAKPKDRVVIGDANALIGASAGEEKRYKISPRRLGEMAGLMGELEADLKLDSSISDVMTPAGKSITSIGRYKVVGPIGRGGMGTVYEGTDARSGARVAIKLLSESVSPDLSARFEREALIMSELNHPNIVRLYDWGRGEYGLYIAMEFLDGPTLEEVMTRQSKLRLDVVVAITRPVAEAVQYVHEKGFVRNDIKPSNIMLTAGGRVCLLDFGITRPLGSRPELQSKFISEAGMVIGTLRFMAPEQAYGEPVDQRSDIFSLGVVVYHLLTGVFPFEGSTTVDTLRALAESSPTPPSQHIELPAAVNELILKCLERDPNKRFQTMAEFIESLDTAVGDMPLADLKSLIRGIRKEVREVEAMDQMATTGITVLPAHKQAPPTIDPVINVMAQASHGTGVSVPTPSPSGPLPAPPSMEEPPAPAKPLQPLPQPVSDEKEVYARDTRPRIRLIEESGSTVSVYLQPLGCGYLLDPKTSIGRYSENNIVIRSARVSRHHAEVTLEADNWYIKDLNSNSGTWIEGERIISPRLLKDGDEIQVADYCFVFNRSELS